MFAEEPENDILGKQQKTSGNDAFFALPEESIEEQKNKITKEFLARLRTETRQETNSKSDPFIESLKERRASSSLRHEDKEAHEVEAEEEEETKVTTLLQKTALEKRGKAKRRVASSL